MKIKTEIKVVWIVNFIGWPLLLLLAILGGLT